MEEVSAKYYLQSWIGGICVISVLIFIDALNLADIDAVGPIISTLLSFYMIIIWTILLSKAWNTIQDGQAKMGPVKAVVPMFIPLFHCYWVFPSHLGLAREFNAYLHRHSISIKGLNEGLFKYFAIMFAVVFSYIPLFLIPLHDFFALLAGLLVLALLVLGAIIIKELCTNINDLAAWQNAGAYITSTRDIGWPPSNPTYPATPPHENPAGPQPSICPACSAPAEPGARFCEICGAALPASVNATATGSTAAAANDNDKEFMWDGNTCWFCNKPAMDNKALVIRIRNNKAAAGQNSKSLVKIPRCSDCYAKMKRNRFIPVAGAFGGGIAGVLIPYFLLVLTGITDGDIYMGAKLLSKVLMFAGVVVGAMIGAKPGERWREKFLEFPILKQMLRAGWKITR